jgi:hypothetical protein
MINVEPGTYKFLLHGRTVQVRTPRAHRPGQTTRAGIADRRNSNVRVRVLEVEPEPDGHLVRIQLAPDRIVHYLAGDPGANRGDYTTNPIRAARETNGGPIEAAELPRHFEPTDPIPRLKKRNPSPNPLPNPRRGRYTVASSLPVKNVRQGYVAGGPRTR